jgi:hypothetical protein
MGLGNGPAPQEAPVITTSAANNRRPAITTSCAGIAARAVIAAAELPPR